MNFSDKLNDVFKKSKENEISHISLDIDLSKTNYLKEFATSEFLMNITKNYIKSDKISISDSAMFHILCKYWKLKKKIMHNIFITIMILSSF